MLNFSHRIIVFKVRVREILTMKIIVFHITESIYSLSSRNPMIRIGFSYVALHQDVRNFVLFLRFFSLPLYHSLVSLTQTPTTNY